MTIWEGLLIIGVYVAFLWWAQETMYDACEECNYDCSQGRNCPRRK